MPIFLSIVQLKPKIKLLMKKVVGFLETHFVNKTRKRFSASVFFLSVSILFEFSYFLNQLIKLETFL